jgi:hypothetical protein
MALFLQVSLGVAAAAQGECTLVLKICHDVRHGLVCLVQIKLK